MTAAAAAATEQRLCTSPHQHNTAQHNTTAQQTCSLSSSLVVAETIGTNYSKFNIKQDVLTSFIYCLLLACFVWKHKFWDFLSVKSVHMPSSVCLIFIPSPYCRAQNHWQYSRTDRTTMPVRVTQNEVVPPPPVNSKQVNHTIIFFLQCL